MRCNGKEFVTGGVQMFCCSESETPYVGLKWSQFSSPKHVSAQLQKRLPLHLWLVHMLHYRVKVRSLCRVKRKGSEN